METSTEKVLRLLAAYPKNYWEQKELASSAACSKAFLSKLTKKLLGTGIIARPSRNSLILISLPKLLNYWISLRKLPNPVYFKMNSYGKTLDKIKKLENCCLTLFSAAYIRSEFIKTNRIELYFYGDMKKLHEIFGKPSKFPTNLMVFISDKDVATDHEIIRGLKLVSLYQNYVDLVISGGTGVRAAVYLDKKYNIMGV